jgi:hypothetical protein
LQQLAYELIVQIRVSQSFGLVIMKANGQKRSSSAEAALSFFPAVTRPKQTTRDITSGAGKISHADHERNSQHDLAWPRKPKDPLLDTPRYRANRARLKLLRLPCAVCGKAIDYTQPAAFVAGHIVSRRKAKQMGWTEAQINALSNLRPECRPCSNKTGAREGQQAQRAKLKNAPRGALPARQNIRSFDNSRDW